MGYREELEQRLMACHLEPEAAKIMESWLGLSGERLHEFVSSVLRVLPGSWLNKSQIVIWQEWCIGSLYMIKRACALDLQEFMLLCNKDPFYALLYERFPARDYEEIERLTLRFYVKRALQKRGGNESIASFYVLTQKQMWATDLLLGMAEKSEKKEQGTVEERKKLQQYLYTSGRQVFRKITDVWKLPEAVHRRLVAEDSWWAKLARHFPERTEEALMRIKKRLMPQRRYGPYGPRASSEERIDEKRALQNVRRSSFWRLLNSSEQAVLETLYGLDESGIQHGYRTTGEKLGMPPGTVQYHMASAKRRLNDLNPDSRLRIPDYFVRRTVQRKVLSRSPYDGLTVGQRFRREVAELPELTDRHVAIHLPFVRESEEHAQAIFLACIREAFPRAYRWARRRDVQNLVFSAEELIQEACMALWCAIPSWPRDSDAASIRELARDAIYQGIHDALRNAGIWIREGRNSLIPDVSLDDPVGSGEKAVRRDLIANPFARPPDEIISSRESEVHADQLRASLRQKLSLILTDLECAVIFHKFGFETEPAHGDLPYQGEMSEDILLLVEREALEKIRSDDETVSALRRFVQEAQEIFFWVIGAMLEKRDRAGQNDPAAQECRRIYFGYGNQKYRHYRSCRPR